jgi:protein-S-isoprenylcysteine O-methyltransferase Ste14
MTLYRYDAENDPTSAARWAGMAYGIGAFVLTFAFFAHFVIFLGNLPKTSDTWVAPSVDIGGSIHPFFAAIIDIGLVALFGLQHSLMARPRFKDWWTRIVPHGLERSTYVIAASAAGFVMLVFWQPIPFVIWQVDGTLAAIFWVLFAAGWLLLLASTISFDIFELLGIRQSFAWANGDPPRAPTLKTGGPYRLMRHPMYVGVLLGLWMTPLMTAGHALIAASFTIYILIARRYEERDLRRRFGARYQG